MYLPTSNKTERRVRAAASMLGNGMQPAEITAALRERFRVTLRTAQRDLDKARKMSP